MTHAHALRGYKIAILATDGFEQSELMEPKKALEHCGAHVSIISLHKDNIKGWSHNNWGSEIKVDQEVKNANAHEYDALVLPGGVINPDKLRFNADAVNFVKEFVKENKPIAAICHGPWTLINAEGVKGKTMTSWGSIKLDLINAGAQWVDKEVVRDGKLVTSRMPSDLPAFNEEMIKVFSQVK